MKTNITLPPAESVTITEIILRPTEVGVSATATAGAAVFATIKMAIRDGDSDGCRVNATPKTVQGALMASEHRTPKGRTNLLKAISKAVASGKDLFAAAEECGKSDGWFLG